MPVADYKIILDSPSSLPALGFDNAANALKDIVEGSSPQFVIGIFGTWGSGKTTLMRAIERRLDPTKTIAVQFSAWRYEREPHLIVPLLDTMREALVTWSEQNKTFKKQAIETAATVGKAIHSLLAGMSLKVGLPNALEVSFEANKALEQAAKFDDDEKEARVARSFYHAAFNALSDTFKKFLGSSPGRRIVIFVDDLDRCLPQGALEVLEAMKLFFDLDGFVFVVGLDQAVVERSIDLKYRLDSASGDKEKSGFQVRGADYIKKIFQLPYALAPVAVTQLDEFLNAVYAEAQLHPDQLAEIQTVVTPHLRYIVTDSGVNPREIKRYINAYTLVIKIKSYLTKDVVLALQTIAFRRDWEIVRRALLSYRGVFTDAVLRQLGGDATAIADLDPTLAGIPESFMSYVTIPNPGSLLLTIPNLDEYIYAGASTTSSQGSEFIDAIRDVANVSKALRELGSALDPVAQSAFSTYRSLVTSAISRAKQAAYGRLDRLAQNWMDHSNSLAAWTAGGDPRQKTWTEEEEVLRGKVLNQLMELYTTGSQIASSAS